MERKTLIVIAVIVAIGVASFAVYEVFFAKPPAPKETYITVWFTYEGYDEFLGILKEVNGTDGVYVKVYYYSSKGFVDKFIDAVQAGMAPDIILVKASWLDDLYSYLYDLKDLLTPDVAGSFIPETLGALTLNDTLLGIPFYMDLPVVVYNKRLLSEAGAPEPTANWTTDDLISIAEKVNTTLPGVWGVASTFCSGWLWAAFQYAFGHGPFVSDGKIIVNDTASVETAEFYANITRVLRVGVDVGKQELISLLVNNQTAMGIIWNFFVPDIVGSIDIGVAPLPIVAQTGERPRPFADVKGFGIYKNSKHVDEAFDIILHIVSPDNVAYFCNATYKVPALKRSLLANYTFSDIMDALLIQSEYVQEPPKTSVANEALKSVLSDALCNIIQEGMDPKAALDQAQQQIYQLYG